MGECSKNLHMTIAWAASPASVALPFMLSQTGSWLEDDAGRGQSSREMTFACASGGRSSTMDRKGSVHPTAKRFIKAMRSSLVGGTSMGSGSPRKPGR